MPVLFCLLRILSQLLLDRRLLTGVAERGEQGSWASYHKPSYDSAYPRLLTGAAERGEQGSRGFMSQAEL